MPYYTSNVRVDATLAVTDKEIVTAGDFLMLDKCSNEIEIKLDSNKNHSIRLREKDVIRAKFKKIYVTVPIGSDAYLKIIGSPDQSVIVEPATRVVSEILKDKSDWFGVLNDENSFMYSRYSGHDPATYAANQLFNPSDSKINIIVDSILMAPTGSNTYNFGIYNEELLNDNSSIIINKSTGVNLPNAKALYKNLDDIIPNLLTIKVDNDSPTKLLYAKSLILRPGMGFVVQNKTPDISISFCIEWSEIPV